MAKTLILPGEFSNILSRAESVSVVTPGSDPDFPVSNLYDLQPNRPWRASAKQATVTIEIFAQFLKNGLLNNWAAGLPVNWAHNGTGTVTQETTIKTEGSSSARLDTTGSTLYQNIAVRAGESLRITGNMRALAASDQVVIRIFSLRNGLSLQSSGSWATGANAVFTETSTTFQTKTLDFSIQSVADLRGASDIIRVELRAAIDGGYFDNWKIIPEVDFVSFHGHNFGSNIADEAGSGVSQVVLRSDDASPPSTTRATFVGDDLSSPSFYNRFSAPLFQQYWSVELTQMFVGVESSILDALDVVEIGELVIGKATELIQNPSDGVELIEDWPQERQEVEGVTVQSFNLSRHPRRRVRLPFNVTTPTYEQARDFIFRVTRGGQDPIVIVPDNLRPEVVFGHIDREFSPSAPTFDRWAFGVMIEESASAVPLA